jgi:hypothetical protein
MHLLLNADCTQRALLSLMPFAAGAGTGMGACAGPAWQAGVKRCPGATTSKIAYKQGAVMRRNAKYFDD